MVRQQMNGGGIRKDRGVPPCLLRHPREGGDPSPSRCLGKRWIPAFAGMTTGGVDMFLVADKLKKSRMISRPAGGMGLRPVGCLTEPGIVC